MKKFFILTALVLNSSLTQAADPIPVVNISLLDTVLNGSYLNDSNYQIFRTQIKDIVYLMLGVSNPPGQNIVYFSTPEIVQKSLLLKETIAGLLISNADLQTFHTQQMEILKSFFINLNNDFNPKPDNILSNGALLVNSIMNSLLADDGQSNVSSFNSSELLTYVQALLTAAHSSNTITKINEPSVTLLQAIAGAVTDAFAPFFYVTNLPPSSLQDVFLKSLTPGSTNNNNPENSNVCNLLISFGSFLGNFFDSLPPGSSGNTILNLNLPDETVVVCNFTGTKNSNSRLSLEGTVNAANPSGSNAHINFTVNNIQVN